MSRRGTKRRNPKGRPNETDERTTESPSNGTKGAEESKRNPLDVEEIPILRQGSVEPARRGRPLKVAGLVLATLAVAVLVAFLVARSMTVLGRDELVAGRHETKLEEFGDAETSEDGSVVEYDGKRYARRGNVATFLAMGIDDVEGTKDSENAVAGDKGQADAIFYGVLDVDTGETKVLAISRDAMTDVELYDADGNYAGTEKRQICLAYSYGGKEEVARAVSNLLFGAPVDVIAAVDLPAVSVMTDLVGGVEVTLDEDLTAKNPNWTSGSTVFLTGSDAMTFVRTRDSSVLESNENRMGRQKKFLVAFLDALRNGMKSKPWLVFGLYDAVSKYSDTNLTANEAAFLVETALRRRISPSAISAVRGTLSDGEYAELKVDEKDLYEKVLDMLYEEVGANAETEAEKPA